jgi:hypothetical protein
MPPNQVANHSCFASLAGVMVIRKVRLNACRYHGITCWPDQCAAACDPLREAGEAENTIF